MSAWIDQEIHLKALQALGIIRCHLQFCYQKSKKYQHYDLHFKGQPEWFNNKEWYQFLQQPFLFFISFYKPCSNLLQYKNYRFRHKLVFLLGLPFQPHLLALINWAIRTFYLLWETVDKGCKLWWGNQFNLSL